METEQEKQTKISFPVKEIQINGTNLNYIEKGTGEAVVFIHGAVSDFRTWIEQINEFSADYRAISYSRKFHQPNGNGNGNKEYSRVLQMTDLIEFLKSLDIKKAHLVGHSYGASIALMAAIKNPELVASLTLGEPSPFPSLLNETEMLFLNKQKSAFEEAVRIAEEGNEAAAVRNFLHTVVGVDVLSLLPDEHRAVVLENSGTLLPMLKNYYDSMPISCKELKFLTIPTLLITGELSPKIARISNEAINNCLPNSKVAILKGASHGLQIENAAGFNKTVLNFLAADKLSSGSNKNSNYTN